MPSPIFLNEIGQWIFFFSFFFFDICKEPTFWIMRFIQYFSVPNLINFSLLFSYCAFVILFCLPCTLNNFLNCKYIYFTLAFIARAIWGYIFSSSHCFKCIPLILTCNISSYYFFQKFWNFNSYFPSSHSCLIEGFKFPNRRNLRSF